jgi:hypothetical protein
VLVNILEKPSYAVAFVETSSTAEHRSEMGAEIVVPVSMEVHHGRQSVGGQYLMEVPHEAVSNVGLDIRCFWHVAS